ncbi:MAG: alanine--tRNA ligase-related protein [Candidatus Aminicenantaceae bacterium]
MKKETKRLYLEDPYQVKFDARVIEKVFREKKPALILDQTCFYPESGGQPYDKGTINGINVINVLEDNGKIVHILEKAITTQSVSGKIDWETRFDHMQQHSGQHILSQSFNELFGAETLSFHLGEVLSTVEIDLGKISDEDVKNVEKRSNEIVFQNREIKSYSVLEEQVKNIPLRRPPKKKGEIRVIEVSDFDFSACGGTHVRRAGEIGLIKILSWEKIRNNCRFEFVCGKRAFEDYVWKNRILRELSNRFTVHEREILPSVEKLSSDLKSQKRKTKKMQEKIVRYEAQDIVQKAKEKIIKKIFTDKTQDELRFLALSIIREGDFIVLFGMRGEKRGHLVLACSENFNIDMRELVPVASSLIKGKGGGRESLVEIAGEDTKNIELALDKLYKSVRKKIEPDL